MPKGYKNSQGKRGFLEKKITPWTFGGEEDNTMSKSRETPPQTASDNRDWPMG